MAKPQVSVLGPIGLSVDESPISLGASMLRAVLARLVVAGGRAVTTDRLIEDIWEGQPPASAASVLQVHIHNLRRAMEPDRPRRAQAQVIVSESSGYALKLASEAVDAWQFEALLLRYEQQLRDPADPLDLMERRRALDAVLACWKGEPFEALTNYAWAAREAARLTDLRLTAAELRAQVELELNRPTEVAIELRSIFDEHPEREECARLLATAQYRTGQQAQALATLRRSREYLGEEFGIDPSPALRELETAILSHSAALAATAEPATPAVVPHSARPPALFAGYTHERATLLEVADACRSGRLQLVWVAGPAGVGKTTLVDSVLDGLALEGWTVLRGCCPEVDGAPPAWAWSEILLELDSHAPPALVTGGDAFTLARTVVEHCKRRATPVAVLLEDVHRTDNATLQVLRQVVNWLRNQPVLIMITLRGSKAEPGLHATAGALAHSTASWLELTGLDLDATRAAARSGGLGQLSEDRLHQLYERTGGNPLFIREMAKLVAAQGSIDAIDHVPDSIRELINHRIEGLPGEVVAALQQLAIWRDGVDLRILSLAAEISEDGLIDLIATAEAHGLVRTDRTGRITFDHALIHETVYLSIPVLRRVRMHWAAVELLEKHGEDFPGLARDPDLLAHNAILGARPDTAGQALEYVLTAARRSAERGMRADTARLWQSAIELHELAGHDAEHAEHADRLALFEAHCELVNARAYQGRLLDARHARDRAIVLARELGGTELLVRALTCWRGPVGWSVRSSFERDRHIMDLVEGCLSEELPVESRIRLLAAAVFEFPSDPDGLALGHRFADQAMALASGVDDPELRCVALNAAAFIREDRRPDPHLADECRAVIERFTSNEYRSTVHLILCRSALDDSDLPAAIEQARLAIDSATDAQLPHLLSLAQVFTIAAPVLFGDLAAAERIYEQIYARSAPTAFADDQITGRLTLSWARGDLSGLVEPLGHMYRDRPELIAQPYALALLHAGDRVHARQVFNRCTPVNPHFFEITMTVFRAAAAIELGDLHEMHRLYRKLAPHTGTIAGLDTGLLTLGPMDTILAGLADGYGDARQAAIHRARADELLQRLRTELATLQHTERMRINLETPI
ncbi:BTAD domain-containing putative transcriptional regulator [Nocardia sp. NPDC051030]|uniref:BTAD domain-containing putative transcriptional regulator n=1 Tax=Nocardia sp. NPDC051030 TaxID=3155162 RepID=UPI003431D1E6